MKQASGWQACGLLQTCVQQGAQVSGFGIDEKHLRARALQEAAELYRSHGTGALDLLAEWGLDPQATEHDRRRFRLARTEIERLDRIRRNGAASRAMVVWKPPLFSLARLAQFLRIGRRRF